MVPLRAFMLAQQRKNGDINTIALHSIVCVSRAFPRKPRTSDIDDKHTRTLQGFLPSSPSRSFVMRALVDIARPSPPGDLYCFSPPEQVSRENPALTPLGESYVNRPQDGRFPGTLPFPGSLKR